MTWRFDPYGLVAVEMTILAIRCGDARSQPRRLQLRRMPPAHPDPAMSDETRRIRGEWIEHHEGKHVDCPVCGQLTPTTSLSAIFR